jgi:hypothetical protein
MGGWVLGKVATGGPANIFVGTPDALLSADIAAQAKAIDCDGNLGDTGSYKICTLVPFNSKASGSSAEWRAYFDNFEAAREACVQLTRAQCRGVQKFTSRYHGSGPGVETPSTFFGFYIDG